MTTKGVLGDMSLGPGWGEGRLRKGDCRGYKYQKGSLKGREGSGGGGGGQGGGGGFPMSKA